MDEIGNARLVLGPGAARAGAARRGRGGAGRGGRRARPALVRALIALRPGLRRAILPSAVATTARRPCSTAVRPRRCRTSGSRAEDRHAQREEVNTTVAKSSSGWPASVGSCWRSPSSAPCSARRDTPSTPRLLRRSRLDHCAGADPAGLRAAETDSPGPTSSRPGDPLTPTREAGHRDDGGLARGPRREERLRRSAGPRSPSKRAAPGRSAAVPGAACRAASPAVPRSAAGRHRQGREAPVQ